MRRWSVVAGTVWLVVAAQPAFAQTIDGPQSESGKILVMLAAIGSAMAVFLLIVILFGKSRSTASNVQSRLGAFAGEDQSSRGFFAKYSILRRAAKSAESAAEKQGATSKIESALEQADIPMRAGEAIVAAMLVAVLTFILLTATTRAALWGFVGGFSVLLLSLMFVNTVASRQRKKFGGQLPDTLNLLATSLRAGYSLLQAVEAVGEEAPEPTRREFGRAIAEIRLGRPMNESLSDIAVRMDSTDFEWTVLAIEIQREVGGNLAEVLQTTSETMVQRNRLRREMKALTAEGRISAIVLSVLPVGLFIFISLANPGYMEPLVSSPIGLAILGGGIVFIGIGIFWMQKIVKVDA